MNNGIQSWFSLLYYTHGRPGLVVTWGKLSQWLFKTNHLLERSIGHILDVSVNANYFSVQCFVIVSAALTRDRVLHFLPRKKNFTHSIFT